MNWKLFLQTIAAAAIAGSAQAATGYIGSVGPTEKMSWRSVGNSAMLGAVLAALTILTKAPAPLPTPIQS